jgi:hypothetical protein
LIIPGSYLVVAYNLTTGEKLWWVRGMSWQQKSAAVVDGDIVYVCGWASGGDSATPAESPTWEEALARYDANHDGKLTPAEVMREFRNFGEYDLDRDQTMNEREWNFYRARKASQNICGDPRGRARGCTDKRVLWRYRKSLPNVPSPLLYQGVLYLVRDGGIMTSLDPRTGEPFKVERSARSARPLLVLTGGRRRQDLRLEQAASSRCYGRTAISKSSPKTTWKTRVSARP